MSSGQNNEDESAPKEEEEGSKLAYALRHLRPDLVAKFGDVLSEPVPENLKRLIERLKESESTKPRRR